MYTSGTLGYTSETLGNTSGTLGYTSRNNQVHLLRLTSFSVPPDYNESTALDQTFKGIAKW